jgi:redox-sensitive bicupin YhaK (pirin superfamily)
LTIGDPSARDAMSIGSSIVQRTIGAPHGLIRRMVSPGDAISELIKPFVFLDFINAPVPDGAGFGFHPHSGIATLTYALDADVAFEDTAGQQGVARATGLAWMRAGGAHGTRGTFTPTVPMSPRSSSGWPCHPN